MAPSSKTDTEVIIGGKVFTLSGYESEEYLQRVASYINNKVNEYSKLDNFRRQPVDTQGVLLQLNIADDYFKAKKEAWIIQKDNERKDKMVLDMKHEVLDSQSGTAKVGQENEALKDDLEEAEKKIVELNVKNEDNMMKVSELEEKLSKAEAENSGNAARLEDAEKEYTELKAKLEETEKENGELKAKIEAAERRITDLENRNRRGKR